MRIVLVGAAGFIGSAVAARLLSDSHEVVALARRKKRGLDHPRLRWTLIDLKDLKSSEDWRPILKGAGAVIYCAGVLQASAVENPALVHFEALGLLIAACEAEGVRRFIHFSAVGVGERKSEFSRTKIEGDEALARSRLDWAILRPAFVAGTNASGGAGLLRQLAAAPILVAPQLRSPLQTVQIEDVVLTVIFFLRADAPARVTLEMAAPEQWTLADVVAEYRRWLGWTKARTLDCPNWLARRAYALGEMAARLGWRTALRGNAAKELRRGVAGDPSEWTRTTGIVPKSLSASLAERPSSEQDRWHASLALLKPLLLIGLSAFWVLTGLLSVGPGFAAGADLMERAGAGALGGACVIAGGVSDILIGALMLWRPATRRALIAGVALSLFYFFAATLLLPELWLDPIGPMLKIWPIVACHLVMLAIVEKR